MMGPSHLHTRIIETLYCEAVILSDEVRTAFSMPREVTPQVQETPSSSPTPLQHENAYLILMQEGLNAANRMMKAIAWLQHQRAYFAGEITELQRDRRPSLCMSTSRAISSLPSWFPAEITDLIETSQRFYERLLRLEHSWRSQESSARAALETVRQRIETPIEKRSRPFPCV